MNTQLNYVYLQYYILWTAASVSGFIDAFGQDLYITDFSCGSIIVFTVFEQLQIGTKSLSLNHIGLTALRGFSSSLTCD